MIQIISIVFSLAAILLFLYLIFIALRSDFRFSKRIFHDKATMIVYWILRVLILFPALRAIQTQNYENILLCVMSLVLFVMPSVVEKRFKIEFPTVMECIILCFIFAHEILGEIGAFYVTVPWWDTMLHTLSGFLLAAIGFSLFEVLNNTEKVKMKLSPFYLALVAFCFSMTVGVLWEFVEYSADHVLHLDMQKDTIVQTIDSVALDETKSNIVIHYDSIDHTVFYTDNGEMIEIEGGYLDLGINDTMKDLFVCFIGAATFSTFGYFNIKYEKEHSFTALFVPRKKED